MIRPAINLTGLLITRITLFTFTVMFVCIINVWKQTQKEIRDVHSFLELKQSVDQQKIYSQPF